MSQSDKTHTPFHQYYLGHEDLLAYENGPGYAQFHAYMFEEWFDKTFPANQDQPAVIGIDDLQKLIIDYIVYPNMLREHKQIVDLNNQLDNLGHNNLGKRDDIEGEIEEIISQSVKDKAEVAARFITLAERNGRFMIPFIDGNEAKQPTWPSYWVKTIAESLQDFGTYRTKEMLAVANLFSRSAPGYDSDNDPRLAEVYDDNKAIQSFCTLIPEFEYPDYAHKKLSLVADRAIDSVDIQPMPEVSSAELTSDRSPMNP